jgi:hypothetical protein
VADAKAPGRLKTFVTRWEMAFHVTTVLIYAAAIVAVVVLFPDVSNLWVSIFVLTSGFTAAVASAISAIKSR